MTHPVLHRNSLRVFLRSPVNRLWKTWGPTVETLQGWHWKISDGSVGALRLSSGMSWCSHIDNQPSVWRNLNILAESHRTVNGLASTPEFGLHLGNGLLRASACTQDSRGVTLDEIVGGPLAVMYFSSYPDVVQEGWDCPKSWP